MTIEYDLHSIFLVKKAALHASLATHFSKRIRKTKKSEGILGVLALGYV